MKPTVLVVVAAMLYHSNAHAESTHRYEIVSEINQWNPRNLGVFGGPNFEAKTGYHDSLILVDLNGDKLQDQDLVYIYSDTYDVFAQLPSISEGALLGTAPRMQNTALGTFIVERLAGPGTVENHDRIQLTTFSEFALITPPGATPLPFSQYVNKFLLGFSGANVAVVEKGSSLPYTVEWSVIRYADPDRGPAIQLGQPHLLTREMTITNYLDLDPHVGAFVDAWGFGRTYDGHTGIDFAPPWPTFRQMQLGGLDVVAVAGGIVGEVIDWNEDRCHGALGTPTFCPGQPAAPVNRISIVHDDGSVSLYVHIMRGSSLVKVGDSVDCGTVIAKIGSAGISSGPHLHFELRRPVDPDFFAANPVAPLDPFFGQLSYLIEPFLDHLWISTRKVADSSHEEVMLACVPQEKEWKTRLTQNDKMVIDSGASRGYEFDPCLFLESLCGFDSFCGTDLAGQSACRVRGDIGATCSDDKQCLMGLHCAGTTCAGMQCTSQCPAYRGCYTAANGACVIDYQQPDIDVVSCGSASNCPLEQGCFFTPLTGCVRVSFSTTTQTGSCDPECLP